MKYLLMIALLALPVAAGEITVTFKNDAGVVVTTSTFTLSAAVLAAINDWRLEQIETPATTLNGKVVPAVLRYPTSASLWRGVLAGFVRSAVGDRLAEVKVEQVKIEAANATIKVLKESVVQ